MYVKMLDGPFAGEIKDLRSDVALDFIQARRAERAYLETVPVVAEAAPEKQETPCAAKGNKPKRSARR